MSLVGENLQNVENRRNDPESSSDTGESVNHWHCRYFNNQYDNEEYQPEDGYIRLGPGLKADRGEEILVP